jgi:hypothetical protein
MALAERGHAPLDVESLPEDRVAIRERQDLETSIKFCRECLGPDI